MNNYDGQMHYGWEQSSWNGQCITQGRIIWVKISGTAFPYSDLHVIAELHLCGAQYSQPIFYRKTQGDK